jgi:hypothetical protein
MALCHACGQSVPEGALACPGCGRAEDRTIPCLKCGFPVEIGTEWCNSCGCYLGKPRAQSAPRYSIQYGGEVIRSGGAALGVAFPQEGPQPVTLHDRMMAYGTIAVTTRRTDPYFLVALVLGLTSLAFAWMPRIDLGLAGLALIVALLGYNRYFGYKQRGRYSGLWVNYLATVAGIVGLVIGFHFTSLF